MYSRWNTAERRGPLEGKCRPKEIEIRVAGIKREMSLEWLGEGKLPEPNTSSTQSSITSSPSVCLGFSLSVNLHVRARVLGVETPTRRGRC
ncbi:hypothetical protein C0Q70_21534 [Pomacea canaliculata]|uniref:Uncharacterized protein n=1 Tax=Pomacea canaliculata TaxID=400727 RepID=A0A2T7NCU2_POMCA|nr:hypothetical protein C0Q70_21534 [Pomacea canaliculata]